jgi:uncharacterized small protein (DUF1192 family)
VNRQSGKRSWIIGCTFAGGSVQSKQHPTVQIWFKLDSRSACIAPLHCPLIIDLQKAFVVFVIRLLLVYASLLPALCVSAQSLTFEDDVRPILAKHCFECHTNDNLEGSLNLASLAGIQRGGHSGSPLLAAEVDNSELYLRVTSTTDGYRMPKSGPRLSEKEISILSQWIPLAAQEVGRNNGRPLNAENAAKSAAKSAAESLRSTREAQDQSSLGRLFSSKEMNVILICGLGLIALVVWFGLRAMQTIGKRRSGSSAGPVRPGSNFWRWMLRTLTAIVLALLSAWSVYAYYSIEQLEKSNAQLQNKLDDAQRPDGNALIVIDENNLPLPVHPMHPKRLGGTYYRGNDERNEELFNGGFYRTATMELHLVDSTGKRLQWQDEVNDEVFVELSIRRAKEATKELFSPRTRKLATIEHYCQSDSTLNLKTKFESVEEFEHWRAIIPLPPKSQWQDGQVEGMVYLMYGVQVGGPSPRPHFGARYRIALAGNRISNDSELWLGNMFTLGGRVLVPQKGEVLLDRWFDWRPIPEIQGQGTTDPELLGLPEHQK